MRNKGSTLGRKPLRGQTTKISSGMIWKGTERLLSELAVAAGCKKEMATKGTTIHGVLNELWSEQLHNIKHKAK